ncbi:MAG: thioredoxin family protein [Saprospiraceae bacterium]|nr:thioredoxin family protein [Saprospiraceae bacterium]
MRTCVITLMLLSYVFLPLDSYAQKSPIKFTYSESRALRAAERDNKFVFTFIYADWSMPCQKMFNETFQDSSVINDLNTNFINLAVNHRRSKKFLDTYEVRVFPTIIIFDKEGNVYLRFVGFKDSKEVLSMLDKTRFQNRYLKQDLDSLAKVLHPRTVLPAIDSIRHYRDDYSAKNLIKWYLDSRKDWADSVSLLLIKDNFALSRKYLKYMSKNHDLFYQYFDPMSIKENIAFHIYINSLKKNIKGRPKFNYKPVRRWFRKYKLDDVDKMEDFVRIKHLLWGRGPSVRYSVNLIQNYPETTDENVLFASVIRLLIYSNSDRFDYDELIYSLRTTLDEDVSFWRYDALSLLYYKSGQDSKAQESIQKAKARAKELGEEYVPTLDLIKDKIDR